MSARVHSRCWPVLLALALGCGAPTANPGTPDAPVTEAENGPVRQRFAALEAALKAHDADAVWDLLGKKSREDAGHIAREVTTAYAAADPDDKKKQADAWGLSDQEMAGLTGKGLLKGKPFWKKYDDLPGSKVNQVVVTGDSATVHYVDTEGDDEKLIFVREGGDWRVWMRIPRPRAGQ